MSWFLICIEIEIHHTRYHANTFCNYTSLDVTYVVKRSVHFN